MTDPENFDPFELTTEASLNRTVLGDLKGADPRWVGQIAFDALSLGALERLCLELGLPQVSNAGVTLALAAALAKNDADGSARAALAKDDADGSARAALAQNDADRFAAAARVVDEYARRLAHLVATLLTGNAPLLKTTVMSGWRRMYVEYWSGVQRVWLAGGIAAALGMRLVDAASAELVRLGLGDRDIHLAPWPNSAAVLGAARSSRSGSPAVTSPQFPPAHRGLRHVGPTRSVEHIAALDFGPSQDTVEHVVALDFGHTTVKRGVATVRDGCIERLDLFPPRQVPFLPIPPATGEPLVEFVLDVTADTCRRAAERFGNVAANVTLSVATYLRRGRPADPHSLYAPLGDIDEAAFDRRLQELIHDDVRATRGDDDASVTARADVHVALVHDGTAAARGVPDHARFPERCADDGCRAAVITLGTALGVGFVPLGAERARLLRLAAHLEVHEGVM